MNLMEFYRYKEKALDRFCKTMIRNASVDCKREIFHQFNREIPFTDLAQKEIENLSQLSFEETPLLEQTTLFRVQGETVQIEDRALGKAMQFLMPDQREIVLLYYFRHFNDRAIADLLHCSPDTVCLRRQKALQQLRRELEAMPDDV